MEKRTRQDIKFNEDAHEYFVGGVQFPGITGFIGKRTKKDFSNAGMFVEKYREFGSMAHKELELYIREGRSIEHPSIKFVQEYLDKKYPTSEYARLSEVLVSDYETACTAIDIVVYDKDKNAITFDLKTGNFDREYCSWQLGIGNYFLEKDGDFTVRESYVIATKDSFIYKIFPKSRERCIAFLAGHRK